MKLTSNQNGFTLMELITVIIILGILAAISIPKYLDISDSAEASACKANQKAIEAAIMMYYASQVAADPTYALAAARTEVITTNPASYFSGGALPSCAGTGTITVAADGSCSCSVAAHNP